MRPAAIIAAIEARRGHLFPWVAVAYGAGIGTFFALRFEPGPWHWALLGAAALCVMVAMRAEGVRPVAMALLFAAAGAAVAGLRTQMVGEPVLSGHYYGPIEGRIVGVDRSASDAVRLTLDRVVLRDFSPGRTPARVRVSLHGMQGFIVPEPGLTVILTGHLSPPGGPVEPGGFDFRRQAWFLGLGAVGYTRTPVLAAAPARDGAAGLRIHRLRMAISARVQEALPGRAGAFAAAITTGDRSGMDAATLEALRASNLAHLLAISGLHMGLLTGFVYAALRYGMALVPAVALRWPTRKIAAVCALGAGAFYLALSGGNVATERAFVMVAVMFGAILLDRRALTLRSVALAALIVLTLRPEALTGPGFQMSFAATAALIAVFGAVREVETARVPKWLRPVFGVVLSSAVAGLATAPIAAVHFNQVPHFGLIANTLSVPLMGTVVIPGAVLAALLAPVGLEEVGLTIMDPPIEWILAVAERVASLDGAVSRVPTPPAPVLPLIAAAGVWAILWTGRGRALGLLPGVLAVGLWIAAERPAVLISETGGLLGLLTPEGRVLSKPRGDGFAAASWLENDGDGADQLEAAARAGLGEGGVAVGGLRLVHVTGRGAGERAADVCRGADVVVTTARAVTGPCRVIGPDFLSREGAVALGADATLVTARARSGARAWNPGQ